MACSAHKMSSLFPGSVVLTQNSVGHVSFSSSSKCTSHYMQQYINGTLPPRGLECQVETIPFVTET